MHAQEMVTGSAAVFACIVVVFAIDSTVKILYLYIIFIYMYLYFNAPCSSYHTPELLLILLLDTKLAVSCPNNSTGLNVPSGCVCHAGLSGVVIPTTFSPNYFLSSCSHNSCPQNSSGNNVFSGCSQCNAGFAGIVVPTFQAPNFVNSTCKVVSGCPAFSTGTDSVSGCSCIPPRFGIIAPSSIGPAYFTGICFLPLRFLIVGGGGGGGNRHGGGGGV